MKDLTPLQISAAVTARIVAGLLKIGLMTAVVFWAWNAMPSNKDRQIQPMDAFGATSLIITIGSAMPKAKES